MKIIQLQDMIDNPQALLDRVEAGEWMIVVREGRPVAELRPVPPANQAPRPISLARGAFTVPDDFDDPLPEDLLREFEDR